MSMTLGRFSTSEDPDAGSLRQSGDEVRFESMIVAADLNEFKARVQQLRGLVDNDALQNHLVSIDLHRNFFGAQLV